MKFPDFYKAITNNELLLPKMGAALIDNKKIVLVTEHYIVCSDFGAFVTNPELANERLLDKNMLRWMAGSKVKSLECKHSEIVATLKDGTTEARSYSGHIDNDHGFQRVQLHGEYTGAAFPDWKKSIPLDKNFLKSKGLQQIGLTSSMLSKFLGCFPCEEEDYFIFEFTTINQAVRVTLKHRYRNTEYKHYGIIMPVYVSTN